MLNQYFLIKCIQSRSTTGITEDRCVLILEFSAVKNAVIQPYPESFTPNPIHLTPLPLYSLSLSLPLSLPPLCLLPVSMASASSHAKVLSGSLLFNACPLCSRMPDGGGGHPPAGEPSGPEWARPLRPAVWGCQGFRPPQQTAQTLPGPGPHPG